MFLYFQIIKNCKIFQEYSCMSKYILRYELRKNLLRRTLEKYYAYFYLKNIYNHLW